MAGARRIYDEVMVRRTFASVFAAGILLAASSQGCSSGGGSGGAGAVCTMGFDSGVPSGGTEAASESGQCGTLLTGSKQNGQACQGSSECAPTCCACPGSSRSAQVAWCDQATGTCVVGAEACCAWIANASSPDGGAPFVCNK